ncbi:cleavage and polyadenylation specificity factor subunit 2 [Balamuthia mandrillaris]
MEEGYGWEEKEETDKGKEKDEMDTAKRRKPKTRQLPLHRRVLAAGVPSLLQLKMKRRVPLEGDELVEFRRKEEKERQRKLQEKKEAEKKLKREKREKENQRLLKMMMEEEDFGGQVTSSMPTITIHNPFNDAYDWVPATAAPSLPTKTATLHQQQQQQIVMFPYGENRHQWDEYGQVIDVEAFIQRAAKARSAEIMEVEKRAYLNNNAAEEGKEGTKAEGGEGGEEAAKATSVPTKCIEVNVSISLNCAIKYIDFEGRSDGRSIKAILSHVAPRKVILIHGNAECLEHLRQHCLTNLKDTCKDVLCPWINESIDVTSDTNIYKMLNKTTTTNENKIKLRETLLKSLEFVPLRKDYEIAYANGQISTTTSMMPSATPSRTAAAATSVTHLEATKPGTLIPHPAVFVGELFLADFKEVLTQNGFKTEFSGGVLVCNGVVMLTKEKVAGGGGGSRISISGPLSRDYYKVRLTKECKEMTRKPSSLLLVLF